MLIPSYEELNTMTKAVIGRELDYNYWDLHVSERAQIMSMTLMALSLEEERNRKPYVVFTTQVPGGGTGSELL